MHNKFMIIDGKILQTGSFNYSQAAEDSNAENVFGRFQGSCRVM
jgi:phosphatidylserine/phosphatidylglycerophosphate/cardiolipin synthase-like enzyme